MCEFKRGVGPQRPHAHVPLPKRTEFASTSWLFSCGAPVNKLQVLAEFLNEHQALCECAHFSVHKRFCICVSVRMGACLVKDVLGRKEKSPCCE